jgi:hypothetical protein
MFSPSAPSSPPKTTLEDMEKLACKMWELVVEAWEKSDY